MPPKTTLTTTIEYAMNLVAAFAMFWTLCYGALVVALLLGYRLPWGRRSSELAEREKPLTLFIEP